MSRPTRDLYEGIARAFPLELTPWDDYFLRMAEADFKLGRGEVTGVKSYFVRQAPFNGAYTLLGGITAALRTFQEIRFDTPEFADALRGMEYSDAFIAYLSERGGLKAMQVYAPPEGTPFFPNEPIVTLVGPAVELRIADAILISECNFASLSLTKWNRIVRAVRPGGVLEFARRRSQNHMKSSLYGLLAGCVSTSNDELRRQFDVSVKGTMGHEWVQSYASPREAFDAWLSVHPRYPVGLVDTVRCLEEDFPAWLDAVYEHRESIRDANPPTWGWRNDSGDLAYLTIEQYVRFNEHSLAEDPWFKDRMRIVLTNELDEYAAANIISQITVQARAAGFDAEDILRRIVWAAGTKPGVCEDTPALGGVMKLMEFDGYARIKLALDEDGRVGEKTSIPGFNLSGMVCDARGKKMGILIYCARRYQVNDEGKLFDLDKNRVLETLSMHHPNNTALISEVGEGYTITPRQQLVFEEGLTELWYAQRPSIEAVPAYIQRMVDDLPWWITRVEKPHRFPVAVTPDLFRLREQMIKRRSIQSSYDHF